MDIFLPLDRKSRLALVGGVCLSLVTVVLFTVVFPAYNYSRTPIWGLLWYATGTFFLAAVPGFLLVRLRIVMPVVVTIGLYVSAVF